MEQYKQSFLQEEDNWVYGVGRNGGTYSKFGDMLRFDMSKGFPLCTLKSTNLNNILKELLWFMSGDTNNKTLLKEGVKIWDKWDTVPLLVPDLEVLLRSNRDVHKEIIEHSALAYLMITFEMNPLQYAWLFNHEGPYDEDQVWLKHKDISNVDQRNRHRRTHLELASVLESYFRIRNAYARLLETEDCLYVVLKKINENRTDVLKEIYDLVQQIKHNVDDWRSGHLGPIYGRMFTSWKYGNENINQLDEFIKNLKEQPFSRRHIVSLWDPSLLPDESKDFYENVINGKQALPPCHLLIQGNVRRENLIVKGFDLIEKYRDDGLTKQQEKLRTLAQNSMGRLREYRNAFPDGIVSNIYEDLAAFHHFVFSNIDEWKGTEINEEIYQDCKEVFDRKYFDLLYFMRSNDKPVGQPYNIGSYAAMLEMVCHITGYEKGDLVQMTGNAHCYINQLDEVEIMLSREPKDLPKLLIKNRGQEKFSDFLLSDFILENYNPHPFIKIEVSQ